MLMYIIWAIVKIIIILVVFLMSATAILTWVERKLSAAIQDRYGPERASVFGIRLWGLFHPLADGIKMFFKEDFIPGSAHKFFFWLAPFVSVVPAMLVLVVIPFGPPVGDSQPFLISDAEMGLLFILAVSGLGLYGHVLAGWSSGNKFSLLGAMRTSAQMFSYEVGLSLSLLGVFMVYGTIAPQQLIIAQADYLFGVIPKWGIFTQPLAFILFIAAAMAENKRAPFDLPEADSEIVAGYNIEYSSMRFVMLYLSEFMEIVVLAAFGAVLFLGGWHIPYWDGGSGILYYVACVAAFLIKIAILVYIMMLVRWSVPRMRYDQVMKLGWRILIPAGLINLAATAIVLALIG